ncbi:MAG: epoxide hydrolase [Hyphomonas sp.]|nr:epoxide hydrolase [Hyphomonas sp.]
MSDELQPFRISVSDEDIQDLNDRLRRARLPERETVADDSQGVRRENLESALAVWRDQHDWRRLESEINAYAQYMSTVDGLQFHTLHATSPRADARPLLITHGWPGSIAEFLDVIPKLIDPPSDQPAFHVVMPSLPGYGFTEKPTSNGWSIDRIADAWPQIMDQLGYDRFLVQGGDWGAMVSTLLAVRHPSRVSMLHTTVPWALKPDDARDEDLTPREKDWLAYLAEFRRSGGGYAAVMSTRPQTFGYGLVDSPIGQLAWILEAYLGHGDRKDGQPLVPMMRMIDNAAFYWFTATGASSARLYWESLGKMDMTTPVGVPYGVSVFPKELQKLPRSWVEARYTDLRHWNVLDAGGHFAMLEVPNVFVSELRSAFSKAPD